MTATHLPPAPRPRCARPLPHRATVCAPRLVLHDGRPTRDVDVAYELTGAADAPLLVVLGGISASRHVTAHAGDVTPGWWQVMVGEERAIDTRRWQVLGIDYLGGPGGSSGARALGDGEPARVATQDQARAVVAVLDALGVQQAHAAIGASYGGMVALALAAVAPERIGRAVAISAAARSQPMATALRSLQRQVVRLGVAAGREADAVAIARGIALTTYRTADEFADRFDPHGRAPGAGLAGIEAWLGRNGQRFAGRFDADAFLCLSESLDLHEVEPAAVRAPVTLVAVDSDTLVPPGQSRALHERLGRRSTLHEIQSRFGHDAFLKEPAALAPILDAALDAGGNE